MFICDPITLATSPGRQARREITPTNIAVANVNEYVLASSLGSFGSTPRVIMGRFSLPAAGNPRLGFRFLEGADAGQLVALGFNGRAIPMGTETLDQRDYLLPAVGDANGLVTTGGHFLMVLDRALPEIDAIVVIDSMGNPMQLDWILDLRLLVAVYPTPALRARLRRPRTTVTSITGREWVTTRTDEAVLEALRVPLNNEYRPKLPAELAQLDGFSQFSVWPAGFERVFGTCRTLLSTGNMTLCGFAPFAPGQVGEGIQTLTFTAPQGR